MIPREHKLLFHSQIKNYLTRKLISCLSLFLEGWARFIEEMVEPVGILGSMYAINLWYVLEQVTSHVSAYVSTVKQSIYVRQSVKFSPPLIPNVVHDAGQRPKTISHTYLLRG